MHKGPAQFMLLVACLAVAAVATVVDTPDMRRLTPPLLDGGLRLPALPIWLTQKLHSGTQSATTEDPVAIVTDATSSDAEWVLKVKRSDCSIWQRSGRATGNPNDEVRGMGIIRAPPKRVLALMQDGDEAVIREYNPLYASGYDVEILDERTKVSYGTSRGIFPFSPRDTVTRVAMHELPAPLGGSALLMHAVTHPAAPPIKGHVRAKVMRGVWVMQPVPRKPGLTNFTFAQQIDAGGVVPAWLMNRVVAKDAVQFFTRLNAAASRQARSKRGRVLR